MIDFSDESVRENIAKVIAPDADVRLCYPFGDMLGEQFYDNAYAPLFNAIPDLERRDYIVIAGVDHKGADWVGCAGNYVGTFVAPWLDIPPTGHFVQMRFHEFYQIKDGQVVEVQAIWDIPELMMQANAWPLAPSLGREGCVQGPFTQDGIVKFASDPDRAKASCDLIVDMLTHMVRHPSQGCPDVMEMERFWHPRMTWYGPAGIGTCRGIAGFRNWHQIPFLAAMPDRGQHDTETVSHFFGDGDYVAVTGWPNMKQTMSGAGWLGLPKTDKIITLRSLDFWRIEKKLIRENWVLVDLLDLFAQLGMNVFDRLREFNKARIQGQVAYPVGDI
ncbi:polyketide cyclase [Kiloniella spongiae]|uniref:Polyketide cyclase n=2 Tax=Kiloniella spongiae TaxID=1489064 RepID=A0A0H2MBK7_9PROT|nr:polyketide cyclase [Kiloniella spongiae]